jgi:hypothetical protein
VDGSLPQKIDSEARQTGDRGEGLMEGLLEEAVAYRSCGMQYCEAPAAAMQDSRVLCADWPKDGPEEGTNVA